MYRCTAINNYIVGVSLTMHTHWFNGHVPRESGLCMVSIITHH